MVLEGYYNYSDIDIIAYGRKRMTYNIDGFGRILIDIIIYGRKKCVLFFLKNKWHRCLMVLEGY